MMHSGGRRTARFLTVAALIGAVAAHAGAPAGAAQAPGAVAQPAAARPAEPAGWATGLRLDDLSGGGPVALERVALATHPAGPTSDGADGRELRGAGFTGSAGSVHAAAEGGAGSVTARAGLASLELEFRLRGGTAVLELGSLTAECTAAPGGPPSGTVSLGSARLTLGAARPVVLPDAPSPGTAARLPGGLGELALHERRTAADGTLHVTALRLTLSGAPDPVELTLGSVSCLGGEPEAKEGTAEPDAAATAALRPSVTGADTGEPVSGVLFEAVLADGRITGTCVTGSDGGCTTAGLEPGRVWACIADVPEGYRLPPARERCHGPLSPGAGEELEISGVFVLEPAPAARD